MHSLCICLLQEELLFMWMLLIAAGMCCFQHAYRCCGI